MKTKSRIVYEIVVGCNTEEQERRIQEVITMMIKAQQSFMQSVTGRNYRKCDISLTRINPLEKLVEPLF